LALLIDDQSRGIDIESGRTLEHDTRAKVDGRGAIFWRPAEGGTTMLIKSIAQHTLERVFSSSYGPVLIIVVFFNYT